MTSPTAARRRCSSRSPCTARHSSSHRASRGASADVTLRYLRPATIGRILIVLLLAGFYVHAAREHAARVNTFKARADQSGYMFDAIVLYGDWHGQTPDRLVDRNRMPLYGGFLALFYDP